MDLHIPRALKNALRRRKFFFRVLQRRRAEEYPTC